MSKFKFALKNTFTLKTVLKFVLFASISFALRNIIIYYFNLDYTNYVDYMAIVAPCVLGTKFAENLMNILFSKFPAGPGNIDLNNPVSSFSGSGPGNQQGSSQSSNQGTRRATRQVTFKEPVKEPAQEPVKEPFIDPLLGPRPKPGPNNPIAFSDDRRVGIDTKDVNSQEYIGYSDSIVANMSSNRPEHVIWDPTHIAKRGYIHKSSVSNQPTAKILADYLESYEGRTDHIGFPNMDENHLRFLIKYLNDNLPQYYKNGNPTPTSSTVIFLLRKEN